MMGVLILLVFITGAAVGFAAAYSFGALIRLTSNHRKELRHYKNNLKVAEAGLRRAANPLNNAQMEATIALTDLDLNNDNYLKGR